MNMTRRNFLGGLGAAGALAALEGCQCCPICGCGKPRIAVQLYSIHRYLQNLPKGADGRVLLAKGLAEVAKIGYTGVEFAGYYDYKASELRKMLDDCGLVACGTHVGNGEFGFKIDNAKGTFDYDPEVLKKTCAFNLGYGNDYICCPGGGNVPPDCGWGAEQKPASKAKDEWIKKLCELYNKAAADAAKEGCKIGLHNHMWEHYVKLTTGQSYWDYFFTNTNENVCMEQDVGWTTCAGVDPCAQYARYPGRSPTLHAKENGMGPNVKSFDAILGQPGKPGAVPVDWDKLIPVAQADGVKWFVVECEKHFEDFTAIRPSYEFLKAKGLK